MFPPAQTQKIAANRLLYLRAGSEHRFVRIWVVVVDGRVFVRPWNDDPDGWYRTFLRDPTGAIRIGERSVAIRARRVRGVRLLAAVSAAYADKYTTAANRKYVQGLARKRRAERTLELRPAST